MKSHDAPAAATAAPSAQVIAHTSPTAASSAVSLDERLVRVLENLSNQLATLGAGEAHVPTLMSANDLATMLGADVRTVRRWVREHQVPEPIRIGGTLRWKRSAVERWLEDLR